MEMKKNKKIKIRFTDGAEVIRTQTISELKKRFFEVEESDDPDYVIYSIGSKTEFLKYKKAIWIFHTIENIRPDFNICDYAAEFSDIKYDDRYIRIPNYYFYLEDYRLAKEKTDKTWSRKDIESKEFCNFVYSNGGFADPIREIFYSKLSKYKKVMSGGKYLNNIGGPVEDKLSFQKKFKFSIAFENSSYKGYTTEKILQAFAAGTVPIYYGNPDITKEFNPQSFINCHDYSSFEEVIEKVKELDNNDDKYLEYLNEPCFNKGSYKENPLQEWGDFLESIMSQDKEKAFRRGKGGWASIYTRKSETCASFWYIADRHKFIERGMHGLLKKRLGY